MNITEAEFDALEYVSVVGHVATHDGPHISSLLERLRPFAKRETDSPQTVASTPETHTTPDEGTSQVGCTITAEERLAIERLCNRAKWSNEADDLDAADAETVECFIKRLCETDE